MTYLRTSRHQRTWTTSLQTQIICQRGLNSQTQRYGFRSFTFREGIIMSTLQGLNLRYCCSNLVVLDSHFPQPFFWMLVPLPSPIKKTDDILSPNRQYQAAWLCQSNASSASSASTHTTLSKKFIASESADDRYDNFITESAFFTAATQSCEKPPSFAIDTSACIQNLSLDCEWIMCSQFLNSSVLRSEVFLSRTRTRMRRAGPPVWRMRSRAFMMHSRIRSTSACWMIELQSSHMV
jgi:hypothetical protein